MTTMTFLDAGFGAGQKAKPPLSTYYIYIYQLEIHTVDGQNPAPSYERNYFLSDKNDLSFIPSVAGFCPLTVVSPISH